MLTIKQLKNLIVENTLPNDIIEIIPQGNMVKILNHNILAIKESYDKQISLPSYPIKEYSYFLYKVLTEYSDDAKAIINYNSSIVYVSDNVNDSGTGWKYNHPFTFQLQENTWESYLKLL